MRKVILSFFLFLCFVGFANNNVQAQYPGCPLKSTFPGGNCPVIGSAYTVSCDVNGLGYCCNSAGNCSAAQAKSAWLDPCVTPGQFANKVSTAIGCIDFTSTTGITKSLLQFALGIGGGVAFLLMIFGSFMIMTSSGNPERQQAGKEMITSAIMGLLLILLSVFILQLIGVKILAIPGFG